MASQDGNGSGIVMRAAGAAPAGGAARSPAPAVGPSKRSEVPIRKAGSGIEEKLHTWPFLVRSEFMMSILIIIVLTIWSLMLNAPLEQPSNPTRTPNPSKAPWYFLGLQEMLVFFDPWYAGVVLPSFIIVGLMLIPYLDINPKGNGYYTLNVTKIDPVPATNTPASYTITATAVAGQLKDLPCRSFVVTNTGQQTATDSTGAAATTCWN